MDPTDRSMVYISLGDAVFAIIIIQLPHGREPDDSRDLFLFLSKGTH